MKASELELLPMVVHVDESGIRYRIMVNSKAVHSHAHMAQKQTAEPCSPRIQRIRGEMPHQVAEPAGLSTSEGPKPWQSPVDTIFATEAEVRQGNSPGRTTDVRSPRAEVDLKPQAIRVAQSGASRELSSPVRRRRSASPASDKAQSARLGYASVEAELRQAKAAALATDRSLALLRTQAAAADAGESPFRSRTSPVAREIEEARTRLAANRAARSAGIGRLAYLSPEVESTTLIHAVDSRRSSTIASSGHRSIRRSNSPTPSPRASFVGGAGFSLSWSPSQVNITSTSHAMLPRQRAPFPCSFVDQRSFHAELLLWH
jgi:hypothetical protein